MRQSLILLDNSKNLARESLALPRKRTIGVSGPKPTGEELVWGSGGKSADRGAVGEPVKCPFGKPGEELDVDFPATPEPAAPGCFISRVELRPRQQV